MFGGVALNSTILAKFKIISVVDFANIMRDSINLQRMLSFIRDKSLFMLASLSILKNLIELNLAYNTKFKLLYSCFYHI